MEQKGDFEILSKTFSNPTKLNIVLLLTEHERMTVTQMAQYLSVSRSNIYHFVAQMVSDGILNEPEVVAKKNYVEKYYTLNTKKIDFSEEDWEKGLNKMSVEELRSMISSALMGYSMNLKLSAEQISQTSDEEMQKLRDWLLNMPATLMYSTMRMSTVQNIKKHLQALSDELERSSKEHEGEKSKDVARLNVVFLPFLKGALS